MVARALSAVRALLPGARSGRTGATAASAVALLLVAVATALLGLAGCRLAGASLPGSGAAAGRLVVHAAAQGRRVLAPDAVPAGAPWFVIPAPERPLPVPPDRGPAAGTLRVTVYWPADADRALQFIPLSADRVELAVYGDDGINPPPVLLANLAIDRAAGAFASSASVELRAQDNVSIEGLAYADEAPGVAIASGSAAGIPIVRSRDTDAWIVLDSLYRPRIDEIRPNVARPGDEIELFGENLGPAWADAPLVTFEGTAGASVSGTVIARDGGYVKVAVPAGAAVGRVVVTTDGTASVTDARFWAFGGVTVGAPTGRTPGGKNLLLAGDVYFATTEIFGAAIDWRLAPGKVIAQYGPAPAVSWASSNPIDAGNAIDAETGLFTAAATDGQTDVTARLGNVVSAPARGRSVGVYGLAISTVSMVLNAPARGQPPSPRFAGTVERTVVVDVLESMGFGTDGVDWVSGDTALATVAGGLVKAVEDAPAGATTVTVTSLDDPAVVATVGVGVTIYGNVNVGVW